MSRFVQIAIIIALIPSTTLLADQDKQSKNEITCPAPADACAVLCIHSADEFDRNLYQLLGNFGLTPTPFVSLLCNHYGLSEGYDKAGSFYATMLPPTDNPEENRVAMFFPVTDFDVATAQLNLQPAEGNVLVGTRAGSEMYVGRKDKFMITATARQTIQDILDSPESFPSRMAPSISRRLAEEDVYIWYSPPCFPINPINIPFAELAGGADRLEQLEAMSLAGTISDTELRFTLIHDVTPDTPLDKLYRSLKPARQTALIGIPDEPIILATSFTSSEWVASSITEELSNLVQSPMGAAILGSQNFNLTSIQEIIKLYAELLQTVEQVSFSITLPADTKAGLLAFTKVVDFKGSPNDILNGIEGIITQIKGNLITNPDVQSALAGLEFKRNAETINDIQVHHLLFDITKLPEEADDNGETASELERLFGKDRLLARIGIVRDGRMLITLGGGRERFTQLAAIAKAGKAPLVRNPLILQATKQLQKKRTAVLYCAPTGAHQLIARFIYEPDGRPYPPELLENTVPIAIGAGPLGRHAFEYRLFLTTEHYEHIMRLFNSITSARAKARELVEKQNSEKTEPADQQ